MKNIQNFQKFLLENNNYEISKLIAEEQKLLELASNENKKLLELEDKYFKEDMIEIINSENINKIQEYIDFLDDINFFPTKSNFLFQKQYEIKNSVRKSEKIPHKEVSVDYEKYTNDIIEELKSQKAMADDFFNQAHNLREKIKSYI